MSIPPVAPSPKPDKSRTPILIILVAFFVLVGFGIFSLAKGANNVRSEAIPYADKFLTTIEKGDIQGAKQQLTPEAQKVSSADQIKDILALLEKHRGKMTGHTGPEGFFVGNYNGVTQVALTYKITFEKGETTARIVLVKKGDDWQVYSFNYQL